MQNYLAKKKKKVFDYLKRKRLFKAAAFLQSLPDLIIALLAGYGAYKFEIAANVDEVTKVLKVIAFVLLVVWWALRFYENHKQYKKQT